MKLWDNAKRWWHGRKKPPEGLFSIGLWHVARIKCDLCQKPFEEGNVVVQTNGYVWKMLGGPGIGRAHLDCAIQDRKWSDMLGTANVPHIPTDLL